MVRYFCSVLLSVTLLMSFAANAAEEKEKWDVANPPLETRQIPINVTEGTWMSLDVSPDGSTIAFDLLGDIYLLPIDGGEARNISSGLPWEIQPRFSPDGEQIAFISDRAGGDNLWIMNADGSALHQVTKESFRLLNNPTWSADGNYVAARKHFTTERSAGTGEIWLYHVQGGDGLALVKRSSEAFQKELGEPMFSPDGNTLYFVKNVTSGNQFIYAQDSNTDLFNILAYDMTTGETTTTVSGAGGAVRPAPSPDGGQMAFVRRDRALSNLYIKDLTSGIERMLVEGLDQDMQETWGVSGMYPNMDWTPDGESIVYWAGGGIHRVDTTSGERSAIPFAVNDTRDVIDPPRPQVEVAPAQFVSKMPRFASLSPDGSKVVFESVGKLWIKDVSSGENSRLTRERSDRRELFPAWSRDGRQITFVSWSDEDLGAIHTINASGRTEKTLTEIPGHFRRPQFSPSGDLIVFEKGEGGFLTAGAWSEAPGVYTVSSDGGEISKVSDDGRGPHFAQSEDRVFVTQRGGGAKLVSMDLDGQNQRVHATGELVTEYQVSTDGSNLAFRENYDVHVVPLLPGPQALAVGRSASALPVTELSGNGATYMHWSAGGAQINWSLGPQLFSTLLSDLEAPPSLYQANADAAEKAEDAADSGYKPPVSGIDLSMLVDADVPDGMVALTGARIITMADEQGGIIENGTVLVDGNRIVAVGSDVEIPSDAQQVDVSGHTITPGFIDAHAHGPQGVDDIIPQQNWSVLAHLALGVTTVHDPSSEANHIFSAGEYQRAGALLAPRIYSSGEIVYGAKSSGRYASIDSLDDAKQHVNRLAIQGAHSIKNYNQPRRDQRQQVVAAALEADIAVVAEGGSNYHMDMAMVADGNTSIEHNLPQAELYEDVLSMYSQTKVAYTPTLVVTYGGLAADPYWRQAMDVWLHPILSKHVPPHILQPGSVRRTTAPEEDFVDDVSARTAHKLKLRGVEVSIGAHGQEEGLAAHWEIWSFVRGGFSPLEALQAATIAPARHLGFSKDLGSLETGKLADLVIMRSNPLEDIGNSDDISMVMINGRLYEADTLNEVHTGTKIRQPYYWE